jgi:putative cell wall-binding protein
MGGPAALSAEVATALDSMDGVAAHRIQGPDRFATAAAAAHEAIDRWTADGAPVDHRAVVALGTSSRPNGGWPDALAAGPLAAAAHRPILLVTPDAVPQATSDAIESLALSAATVAGGPVAISEATATALGVPTQRIGGADRYETAQLLASAAIAAGATDREVVAATGSRFPDALAAGALAARRQGVLVLVNGDDDAPTASVADWFDERAGVTRWLRIAGGPVAVSDGLATDLLGRLGG